MSLLPIELFPEQRNQDRLIHLYSENAVTETETVDFWKRSIRNYCYYNGHVTVKVRQLISDFTIDGIVPSSLSACIDILISNGTLCYPEAISRSAVLSLAITFLPGQLAWIGSSKIDSSIIVNELLKEMSSIISAHVNETPFDNIFIIAGFESIAESTTFTSLLQRISKVIKSKGSNAALCFSNIQIEETKYLIDYLVKTKAAVVSPDKTLVKIVTNKSSNLIFSDIDMSKAQLKQTIGKLERRIAQLEEKISDHHQKALSARPRDQKTALFHLKLKISADKAREKAMGALLTLMTANQVKHPLSNESA